MKSRVVRRRGMLIAALLAAAIGSAARSHTRHTNPQADPASALDARTPVPAHVMSMVRRACFDCHSSETRWPWYSTIPVASWLIERDVTEGRRQLNFSRWAEYNPFDRADMLDKVCDLAARKKMPLAPYLWLHPDARLSDADIDRLCFWAQEEATRLVEGGS